jgi:hypothetical protein
MPEGALHTSGKLVRITDADNNIIRQYSLAILNSVSVPKTINCVRRNETLSSFNREVSAGVGLELP